MTYRELSSPESWVVTTLHAVLLFNFWKSWHDNYPAAYEFELMLLCFHNYVLHIKSKFAGDNLTYVADAGFSKSNSNNDINFRSSVEVFSGMDFPVGHQRSMTCSNIN